MEPHSRSVLDPSTSGSTGIGPWLPARAPEPEFVVEGGELANHLAADELSCLILNAAMDGNIPKVKELAKRLLNMGKEVEQAVAEIVAPWNKRRGPLHMAAAYGKLEMCRFLVKSLRLNVNAIDAYGGTPLMFAVQGMEAIDVIKFLLSCGANPSNTSSRRVTALHIATKRGNYEIVKLLLSGGAGVDPTSENGETPLQMAAEDGNSKVLGLLLQCKADCNRLVRLFTPLSFAIFGPSLECVRLLIQAGADVNGGTEVTPLLIAAGLCKIDCIKCLLNAGANADLPELTDEVPVLIAAKQGFRNCVEILFPHTTPLDTIADWSVDGIMQYANNAKGRLWLAEEMIRHERLFLREKAMMLEEAAAAAHFVELEVNLQQRAGHIAQVESELQQREEVFEQQWRLLRMKTLQIKEESVYHVGKVVGVLAGVNDLTTSLLTSGATMMSTPAPKVEDDTWNKRQISYIFYLGTALALLFVLRYLLPAGYDHWMLAVFAAVWGLGSVGLPCGMFGTFRFEKEFSRHVGRIVAAFFSLMVIYGIYLLAMYVNGHASSPSPSPVSEMVCISGDDDRNEFFWKATYFIIGFAVFAGHIISWCTGCITGGDKDKDP